MEGTPTTTRTRTTVNDELDERYNRAAMMLNMDEKMTIPSRRMALKTAMLNIGFPAENVVPRTNERHRKAIGRRRDKLRSTTLPATIDITSPTNISAVTVSSVTNHLLFIEDGKVSKNKTSFSATVKG